MKKTLFGKKKLQVEKSIPLNHDAPTNFEVPGYSIWTTICKTAFAVLPSSFVLTDNPCASCINRQCPNSKGVIVKKSFDEKEKRKLLLETKNCEGYGYIVYLELDSSEEVESFLKNFSIWENSTKTCNYYRMYEMSEAAVNFMQSDTFESFLNKHNVELIPDTDTRYKELFIKGIV